MARDRIEVRLVIEGGFPRVEIHINGRALTDLWTRASGESGRWVMAADVLWPGHRLWMGDPPVNDLGDGDRRSVLACVDGSYDCGGATARIDIGERAVTWSDFETVPDGTAVMLGPFVFGRQQNEQALEKAAQQVR